MFGLFHGDVVDVRQRFGSRCAFDGSYSDFLHLFLSLVHTLLHVGDLPVLPGNQVFQRLNLQFGDAPIRFGVLL